MPEFVIDTREERDALLDRIEAMEAQLAAIKAELKLSNPGKPAQEFRLKARTLPDLAFPVPTFQPTQPGKNIALDLHPSAGATPLLNNGFTWVDCCDADIMDSNANPVRCARLTIKPEGAVFAAVPFNGAAHFNLFFETGNVHRWGVNFAGHLYPVADNAYQIGSDLNRVTDVYLTTGSVKAQFASLDARLRARGM